jgi:hypothetical protein
MTDTLQLKYRSRFNSHSEAFYLLKNHRSIQYLMISTGHLTRELGRNPKQNVVKCQWIARLRS